MRLALQRSVNDRLNYISSRVLLILDSYALYNNDQDLVRRENDIELAYLRLPSSGGFFCKLFPLKNILRC